MRHEARQRSGTRYCGDQERGETVVAGVAPDALAGGGPAHGARASGARRVWWSLVLRCPRAAIKPARRCRKFWALAEAGEISLEPLFGEGLTARYDQLVWMDERIERLDQRIASADEQAKLLMTMPGIGPKTATALLCTAGDTGVLKNGRAFAAWLGRVPRPHSSGGKDRLLGLSKRGDVDTRTLLIHGARAVVSQIPRKEKLDVSGQWLKGFAGPAAQQCRHSGFGEPDGAHRMGSAQHRPTVPESSRASLISAG